MTGGEGGGGGAKGGRRVDWCCLIHLQREERVTQFITRCFVTYYRQGEWGEGKV